MQKYRVSILTVTIALALALRFSKIEYLLLAPLLPGIFAACLFADQSFRARVVLWLSVVGGIALVRTYGISMVYQDEWRYHGADVLGAIVFQLVSTGIVSVCTLLILQRKKPGPWTKKIITFLRNIPLFSKMLVVMHTIISLYVFSVLYAENVGYSHFGAGMLIVFIDFPAHLILMLIARLLPITDPLYFGCVFILGTIQWCVVGWVCTWLGRKFYDRPVPITIPRNAQARLKQIPKETTTSVSPIPPKLRK